MGRLKHAPIEPGDRFGKLTALAYRGRTTDCRRLWLWVCECGNKKEITDHAILKGSTVSCGCYGRNRARQRAIELLTRHGRSATLQYVAWQLTLDRCSNPNSEGWENYGGRGIAVCERWRDYANFYADMGPRPEHHTLDRIDVNGDYDPGNCRWATAKEQSNNMRTNRRITVFGETRNLGQWAEHVGLPRERIARRLNRGWPPEKAVWTGVCHG